MLVHDVLSKSAHLYGDKVFIKSDQRVLTFLDLENKSYNVSRYLSEFPPQSVIGIMLKNSIEYIICYFAIIRGGHIAVPVNPELKGKMLDHMLKDCSFSLLFTDSKSRTNLNEIHPKSKIIEVDCTFSNEIDDYVEDDDCISFKEALINYGYSRECIQNNKINEEDTTLILYTSGTMGKAKGVCLNHKNLLSNMEAINERIGINSSDNMLVIIPFYYSYGNSLILSHLDKGATLTLNHNSLFPKLILDNLEKCNSLAGVASNFIMLLKRSNIGNRNLTALRYVTFAGEPISDWIIKELMELFPKLKVFIMYGQTEATARIAILRPEELETKKGAVGKPIKDVIIEIVEIVDNNGELLPPGQLGDIVVSGPNIMRGYWNDSNETSQKLKGGNKLITGDYGWLDEAGYLYVKGRKDDMIKVGGRKGIPFRD